MNSSRTQCTASVILRREDAKGSPRRPFAALRVTVAAALLLATAASAQVLVITSGGRRAFDREPDTADTNCLGWTYGASPAIGERFAAGNACGSCLDPWSYFVIVWAVSDDGINWRVRERGPGDPTFLGRPPTTAERTVPSNFKGLTRVSLVSQGDYFYIAAQDW